MGFFRKKMSHQHGRPTACWAARAGAQPGEVIISLCFPLVSPHPGCLPRFWCPTRPERHWQTGASLVKGHKDGQGWSTCPVRRGGRSWACSPWRMEGFEGKDLTALHCRQWGFQDVTVVQDRSTGGNELKHERVRLNTGRNLCNMRTVRHGKLFPRECALPPSLEVSQTHLDKTVSNPI